MASVVVPKSYLVLQKDVSSDFEVPLHTGKQIQPLQQNVLHTHTVDKTKPEGEKHASWQRCEVTCISKSYAHTHHKNLTFILRYLCFNLFNKEAKRQIRLTRYPASLDSKEKEGGKNAQKCSSGSALLLVFSFEKEALLS